MAGNDVPLSDDQIINILFEVDDANNSDLEFLTDMESDAESDSEFDNVPVSRTRNLTANGTVSSNIRVEEMPLPRPLGAGLLCVVPPSQEEEEEDDPGVPENSSSHQEVISGRKPIWYVNQDNPFTNNPPEFLGNVMWTLTEVTGGETPFYFFENLFPNEIFELMMIETMKYAGQNGELEFTTNIKEMKVFLGINMVMTYIKYPSYRMYWSSNPALRMDLIADSMGLKRFEKLKKYLHFTDNEKLSPSNKDIFIKVRPILNILEKTFSTVVTPSETMAIDEMLIPFKGRSKAKQYLQSKPKKWGFKVWVNASPDGYVWKFNMYQGKVDAPKSVFGPIGDTVLALATGLENKNHKLVLDNLFTSYGLLKHLLGKKIYVVGTIRSNRLCGAEEKLDPVKDVLKKGRGSLSITTSSDGVTVLRWADRNIVHLVSTYVGREPTDTARRWDGKTKTYVNVERPHAVAVYNKHMGGVDMVDRMVAHYPHNLKNKRFYLRIFYHFMNVALVNSWILYKQKTNQKISFLEFKSEVANSLIKENKKTLRRTSTTPEPPVKKRARYGCEDSVRCDGKKGHWPLLTDAKNALRCRSNACTRKTKYTCKKCTVPVCPSCMESFHEQ